MAWNQIILNPQKMPVVKMSLKSEKVRLSVAAEIGKEIGLNSKDLLFDAYVGTGPELGQVKLTKANNGKGGRASTKTGTLSFAFPAPVLWGERECSLTRCDYVINDLGELIINSPWFGTGQENGPTGNLKVTNDIAQKIINLYCRGYSRARIAQLSEVSEATVSNYTNLDEHKRLHNAAIAEWRKKRDERERANAHITVCPPRKAAGLVKKK